MISKIKIKFITLSMVSLFVLLLVIVIGMNLISYRALVNEADFILDIISQNHGQFPEFDEKDFDNRRPKPMFDHINMETPHESRFFTVIYNNAGDLLQIETSRIASVNSTEAVEYAETALKENKNTGFEDIFRYKVTVEEDKTILTFLDCGRKIDSFNTFLTASMVMSLIGLIVVFIIITYFAERIIRPITESYEKQRRFITDAGHEMRTPLTIINANADLLAMEIGENESIDDIKKQSLRLSKLTTDLVRLSKIEETNDTIEKVEFPVSDVIAEAVMSFNQLAQNQHKYIKTDICPMLSMVGNPQSIEQLVSILLENAIKYSKEDSTIEVSLRKDNKHIVLEVSNKTEAPITEDELKNVFDRFYKIDKSRNSQKGGYGIGLSIAKAIVASHNGKITAHANNENTFTITARFPS